MIDRNGLLIYSTCEVCLKTRKVLRFIYLVNLSEFPGLRVREFKILAYSIRFSYFRLEWASFSFLFICYTHGSPGGEPFFFNKILEFGTVALRNK
jgi:hypothetical protein